ncbi:hypothetical protein [Metasolibacillus meyeri]|uniref:hypothetical protein n=1 Tax=Metasolibacillus meyeri TaxID=1071052 RepID=UPI000D304C65|nr:hypothetical protein [Metasolibacillus meyeri]
MYKRQVLFVAFNLNSTNANATELNAEQITHLESLGFTQEEISKMSEKLIAENLEIHGEVVSVDKKFFKVIESKISNYNISPQSDNSSIVVELDEDTYLKEVQLEEAAREAERNNSSVSTFAATDKHETSYKTVTTTIVSLTAKQQYRVKTSVVWHIMPSNRKIDVIGTGINSAFWAPSPDSQRGQLSWTVRHSCNKYKYPVTDYFSGSNSWSKGASGYTLSVDLPNDIAKSYACASEEVVTLSVLAYYTAEKLASTSQIDAYGKYLHQESFLQIAPSVTFYPLTFGVSASQSDKFTESTTHAQVKF